MKEHDVENDQMQTGSNPQTSLTKMVMFKSDLSGQETGQQHAEVVY